MPELRSIGTADEALLPSMLAFNNDAAPAVNELDDVAFARLVAESLDTIAILDDGQVVGFVVLFSPGAAYASENYVWFSERARSTARDFLYIDRVIVAPDRRSAGIGALLYEHVFALAAESGRFEVTCEVNLDPPNPRSMAFHERRGFATVGTQATKGGRVTVAFLAAPVVTAR